MSKYEQIFHLWKLLDDIDTLDDAVKENDKAFREHTRTLIKKRHTLIDSDDLDDLYARFYDEAD